MALGIRNIGPKSEDWLLEIGVGSLRDLRALGATAAFAAVKRNQRRASLNLLYALEAALQGIDWRELSPHDKATLRLRAGEFGCL